MQTEPSAAASRDSTRNIIVVALVLSVVCSILVSGTAVLLKPRQLDNEKNNRQRIILEVAGLLDTGASGDLVADSSQSLAALFEKVEAHVVELATGDYADALDPETFDALKSSRDPASSITISALDDIAGISRRAMYATVYLVRSEGTIKTMILPIYGYGLWSTMYGFIALEGDANTIAGLRFYQQAETPGLGGEVDNPKWRELWQGKLVFDQRGALQIEVIRGTVNATTALNVENSAARHQVDGLAGSTLTGRGVTNLLHYWLGDEGFGPYLKRLKENGEVH